MRSEGNTSANACWYSIFTPTGCLPVMYFHTVSRPISWLRSCLVAASWSLVFLSLFVVRFFFESSLMVTDTPRHARCANNCRVATAGNKLQRCSDVGGGNAAQIGLASVAIE